MSRPLRIIYPNAWYHVMNRGAGRRNIFHTDEHRQIFLTLLEETCEMFQIEIHAYCLMGNHYHLLVRTPYANLSRAMRHIGGVYTQLYNLKQGTDGPLFRGRYKAKLVDDDCYQLIVSRYIHLNPVEANLVEKPANYHWSSYRAYLNQSEKPPWLSTEIILEQIENTNSLAHIKSYQDYVEKHDMSEINIYFSTKYTSPIIGSEEFKENMFSDLKESVRKSSAPDISRLQNRPKIEFILQLISQYYGIELLALTTSKRGRLNLARLVSIYICKKYYGFTLKSISMTFAPMSIVTVSTCINKLEKRMMDNVGLKNEIIDIVGLIKDCFKRKYLTP